LTLVNEPSAGGVKQTVSGLRKDNGAIKSTFTAKYDGKEYPVTGAPWDRISMKQVDANTFTVEMKNSRGKYHVSGQMVISKDGKTLTLTTQGTGSEGKPITGTMVYDRQ
jgi:hypothetical protein